MKKISLIFALIFVFLFTFTSVSLITSAEETTEKTYSSLEELAEDYITKVTKIDKKGQTTVTLRNIPAFTEAAHKYLPQIDDVEIAQFLREYSGQTETEENLPDEEILEILTGEEISASVETIVPPEDDTAKDNSQTLKIISEVAAGILIIAGAVVAVITKRKKEK